jgi:hypothetical protein
MICNSGRAAVVLGELVDIKSRFTIHTQNWNFMKRVIFFLLLITWEYEEEWFKGIGSKAGDKLEIASVQMKLSSSAGI